MSNLNSPQKILLIDDEREFHVLVKMGLNPDFQVQGASDWSFGLDYIRDGHYAAVLLDLQLRGEMNFTKGLERIMLLREIIGNTPIIIVTNEKERDSVVIAVKNGANDFVYKGEDNFMNKLKQKLHSLIAAAASQKLAPSKNLQTPAKPSRYSFIGKSPLIIHIKETLEAIAEESNLTVLITGETGTGKEVVAHYLHSVSNRRDKPFIPVHLSAITPTLLESTLFGHKKGSYTDAKEDKIGYFQQANGGILFLDEIGDISPDVQIKLLRFLQDKTIRVVGYEKDIVLDVQILTATNKDLRHAVEKGSFRRDLYQRLNVFHILLPSLRERLEDVPLLLAHYFNIKDMHALQAKFTPSVWSRLTRYDWAEGNIRQLQNAVETMKLRQKVLKRDKIDEDCLPSEIIFSAPIVHHNNAVNNDNAQTFDEEVAQNELQRIEAALLKFNRHKGDAAKYLGMTTDDLRYRIDKNKAKYPNLVNRMLLICQCYKIN